jgi:hypothetical protein
MDQSAFRWVKCKSLKTFDGMTVKLDNLVGFDRFNHSTMKLLGE